MESSATKTRTTSTFNSSAYLGKLMAELDRASICGRIAQAREQAGLTQPELGEALDPPVHFRTVQTWESLKQPRVPWDRLDQIARITGVTKEWLLHGEPAASTSPGGNHDLREQADRIEAAALTIAREAERIAGLLAGQEMPLAPSAQK